MKETFPFGIGTLHIIGIGGIGMSSYAEVLHNLGYKVQGSDMGENANVARLKGLGVRVIVGHDPENVLDAEGKPCAVVVRSTAVKDDNVEVCAAKKKKIPVIPRVELLAEIMRSKWCVNISGTHGKTTTTAIIGRLLDECGLDPTILNGGIINAYGSNTRVGKSDWMVVEADESDGTFAKLPSIASVITNIDPEHMDYYKTFDRLKKTFLKYTEQLPFYGVVVACLDHPVVEELIPKMKRNVITYGEHKKADIQVHNIRPDANGFLYDVEFKGQIAEAFPSYVQDVRLPLFGRHNVLNSLTAFAIGYQFGFSFDKIMAALEKLEGVKRRFTTTGVVNDIRIIDDYAHHPVEIEAVLKAARDVVNGKGSGRVIAVMQPHRYSRLSHLFDGFSKCFADADAVVIADVYAAGEEPLLGADKQSLAQGVRDQGQNDVYELSSKEDLARQISAIAQPGDLVVCMGAGDITKWAYALPEELEPLVTVKEVACSV